MTYLVVRTKQKKKEKNDHCLCINTPELSIDTHIHPSLINQCLL
jgi:hypothetical protein